MEVNMYFTTWQPFTSPNVISLLPTFFSMTSPIQLYSLSPGFQPYPLRRLGKRLSTPNLASLKKKYTIDSIMNLVNQFTRNITKYKTNKVDGLFTKKINRSFMYNFNTYGVKDRRNFFLFFKLAVKVIKTEIFLQT